MLDNLILSRCHFVLQILYHSLIINFCTKYHQCSFIIANISLTYSIVLYEQFIQITTTFIFNDHLIFNVIFNLIFYLIVNDFHYYLYLIYCS